MLVKFHFETSPLNLLPSNIDDIHTIFDTSQSDMSPLNLLAWNKKLISVILEVLMKLRSQSLPFSEIVYSIICFNSSLFLELLYVISLYVCSL